MALTGIDAVIFGVYDMNEAKKFLRDWGLNEIESTDQKLLFKTLDDSEIHVYPASHPELAPAIEDGNTVREVIWGTETYNDLENLLSRLKRHGFPIHTKPNGDFFTYDPNGMQIGLRVSHRKPVKVNVTQVNGPNVHHRIDQRSPVYNQAHPIQIGHIVFYGADYEAMLRFYLDGLGFLISDEYPGNGTFMRCKARSGHHNLFVLNRNGKPGINHVAFTVRDIHEVIGGGLAMSRKGWKTEIGPGRHPISSAYFWYFENPLCAALEYYADEDYCTENWVPAQFERKPENFAEWAIAGGIDGNTRRQFKETKDSNRGK